MIGTAATSEGLRALDELAPAHLLSLAAMLDGGALSPPYAVSSIQAVAPAGRERALHTILARLDKAGMAPAHIALLARAVARERERAERVADRVALVWTGPEAVASETRDTSVVVRELFERSRRSVLVSGYVVHGGKTVFGPLAARMHEVPSLAVRVLLNVSRPDGDEREEVHVVADFARRFAREHWPGERAPALFYDPRGLALDRKKRAVLHAKCVVVDDEVALVTSANLTGAAQFRNVEAGVLLRDRRLAVRLRTHFDVLIDHGHLVQAGWVS